MPNTLLVATKNRKKLQEIKDLLAGSMVTLLSLDDIGRLPRIVENGKTFRENAVKKARTIARATGKLTLGEDSGLCVEALDGAPGVYSARFSGAGKSDAKNCQKVLALLRGVPYAKRRAYYVCSIAVAAPEKVLITVEARCYGSIAFEPKGSHGFGYDPIFFIPKYKKTFAQLGEKVKHTMSHRYKALVKLRKPLARYFKG